jgi:hypothetical protein
MKNLSKYYYYIFKILIHNFKTLYEYIYNIEDTNIQILGFTNYEIAKFLNDKGYKTKRGGKKFYYGTIDYIVKSKV